MSKYHEATSFSPQQPSQKPAYFLGDKYFPPKCHGISMDPVDGTKAETSELRVCSVCGARAGVAWVTPVK